MTREMLLIEIPLLGGVSVRIKKVTERHSSAPPRRPSIDVAGVTLSESGPGLARVAASRIVPFRKSA